MLAKMIDNQKQMMAALLTDSAFDAFELVSAKITTYCTFTIDGTYQARFFAGEDENAAAAGTSAARYAAWKQLRPNCLAMIRGRRAPLSFRIVMRVPDETAVSFLTEEGCLTDPMPDFFLNLHFDGTALRATTGTAVASFSAGKAPEQAFDRYMLRFFDKLGISYSDPL